jgi:hypothetical protein
VVPPPMQTQIQRMGGMSSAVIGGFCEHSPIVHELVAKFADMTANETAKEHGWQLKEATAYQIPEAPHTTAAGHRGMLARLPRKQNRAPALRGSQHRVRTHVSPPPGVGRAVESRENQSTAVRPWDAAREWAAQQGATGPLALAAPPRPRSPEPRLQAAGERRVGASLTARAAATHR